MKNDIEERFKKFYEMRSKVYLYRRIPVIIRLDGKAFHTFTRNFVKPFDDILISTMQKTMKYLCENIQGCVLGYTQSDEISLLLIDYQELDSSAWFDYRMDKLVSVSASMATFAFNRYFSDAIKSFEIALAYNDSIEDNEENRKLLKIYQTACENGALFDARAFNLPKEEVTNYFFCRQNDATKNSIQMVGQKYFSQKELNKKNTNDIQDMLLTQKDVNWNNFSIPQKRGTCAVKNKIIIEKNDNTITAQLRDTTKSENAWIIDKNIPIFKQDGREYIEKLVNI